MNLKSLCKKGIVTGSFVKVAVTVLTTVLLAFLFGNIALADFSDVNEAQSFLEAIEYAEAEGIIHGYPDHTFRPGNSINRAEFTKVIIEAVFSDEVIAGCDVNVMDFPDVPKDAWFAKYICIAQENEIIDGYMDGTFGPEDNISFVQSAKILTLAFGFTPEERDDQIFWYEPYLEILIEKKAIPRTIFSFSRKVTRAEMVEMIYRLREGIVDKYHMVLYYHYLYSYDPNAVDLGFGFFKNAGVYNGRYLLLPDLDEDTFEALSPGYGKDKDNAYYFEVHDSFPDKIKTIEAADISSFETFNNVYAKDKDFVYFEGEILEGADPETFKLADMELAEFDEEIAIQDGDLDRARHLMFNYQRPRLAYAMDKNAAYYADQVLEGVDRDTFVAYAFNQYMGDKYPIYAKDQNNIYYKGEKLSIDAETFEIISWQYQKDKEHIYFNNKIIEGANLDTFEVLDDWEFAKDANYVYLENLRLEEANPNTFDPF